MDEEDIINSKTCNHQGISIGEVMDVYKGWVKIKITQDFLYQQDGVRFQNSHYGFIVNKLYDSKKLLTNRLNCGEVGYLKINESIKQGDIILKTTDYLLHQELLNYDEKKIPIFVKVSAYLGQNILLEVSDGENIVHVTGDMVNNATHKEVLKEDIERQIGKWGNTPFVVQNINVLKDNNIFIRLGNLNAIRREACSKLISLRENKIVHDISLGDNTYLGPIKIDRKMGKYIHVLVRNEEQLKEVLRHDVSSVYVTDYSLYLKYKNDSRIYYRISRIGSEDKELFHDRLLIGDVGNLYQYRDHNLVVGDHFFNVVNSFSANELGLSRITVSLELDDEDLRQMIPYVKVDIEKVIYGRPELMVCKNRYGNIAIENQFKKKFIIRMENHVSHIFHCEVLNDMEKMKLYQEMGIHHFRIELFDEKKEDIQKIFYEIESCV